MSDIYRVNQSHPLLSSELLELMPMVDTATIGHVEHLGFVGDEIRPVFSAWAAGSALTVAAPGRDGTVIYRAIDLIRPGDVLVISRVDRDDVACVGGGVAVAAKAKGAAAIVIDGPCTDRDEIVEVGLPVWCRGTSSRTTNRMFRIGGSINVPIACGAAAVLPGYAVLADNDGIFVADATEMKRICEAALVRQERSARVRAHLAAGQSIFDFNPETHT
jgi:regulator of RNase E activity RraA